MDQWYRLRKKNQESARKRRKHLRQLSLSLTPEAEALENRIVPAILSYSAPIGEVFEATLRAGELVAEELRLAQGALGEITGEFHSDDLLGRIFGSFCIGK